MLLLEHCCLSSVQAPDALSHAALRALARNLQDIVILPLTAGGVFGPLKPCTSSDCHGSWHPHHRRRAHAHFCTNQAIHRHGQQASWRNSSRRSPASAGQNGRYHSQMDAMHTVVELLGPMGACSERSLVCAALPSNAANETPSAAHRSWAVGSDGALGRPTNALIAH